METVIETNVLSSGARNTPIASSLSAVSWGAVVAGAVVAAAMSLILFMLGIGLGLGAVSPWSSEGVSGTALGISTILWITLTSLVASAFGGYLTGRLRTRWTSVHTDEVFFRDTAHGFLAWGLATLLTAFIFTSTTAGLISVGVKSAAAVAGGVADTAAAATTAVAASTDEGSDAGGNALGSADETMGYYLDTLFRTTATEAVPANSFDVTPAGTAPAPRTAAEAAATPATPGAAGITPEQQAAAANAAATPGGAAKLTPEQQAALSAGGAGADTMVTRRSGGAGFDRAGAAIPALPEVTRIYARALANDELPAEDASYIGRLVARHTEISAADAEARVKENFSNLQAERREFEAKAKTAADEARSVSAKIALWFFIALLAGAFTGSYSATLGGRQRDA
ncbi:MAG: hypothetical protein V4603_04690 [Pseudomonadota bacterium]